MVIYRNNDYAIPPWSWRRESGRNPPFSAGRPAVRRAGWGGTPAPRPPPRPEKQITPPIIIILDNRSTYHHHRPMPSDSMTRTPTRCQMMGHDWGADGRCLFCSRVNLFWRDDPAEIARLTSENTRLQTKIDDLHWLIERAREDYEKWMWRTLDNGEALWYSVQHERMSRALGIVVDGDGNDPCDAISDGDQYLWTTP